jgi:hypothetical protein
MINKCRLKRSGLKRNASKAPKIRKGANGISDFAPR